MSPRCLHHQRTGRRTTTRAFTSATGAWLRQDAVPAYWFGSGRGNTQIDRRRDAGHGGPRRHRDGDCPGHQQGLRRRQRRSSRCTSSVPTPPSTRPVRWLVGSTPVRVPAGQTTRVVSVAVPPSTSPTGPRGGDQPGRLPAADRARPPATRHWRRRCVSRCDASEPRVGQPGAGSKLFARKLTVALSLPRLSTLGGIYRVCPVQTVSELPTPTPTPTRRAGALRAASGRAGGGSGDIECTRMHVAESLTAERRAAQRLADSPDWTRTNNPARTRRGHWWALVHDGTCR